MAKKIDDAVKARIEEAVGATWDDIKKYHPSQAASIERTSGNPIALVMKKLEEDDEYKKLVEQTDAEAGLAGLMEALDPFIRKAATALLAS